MKGAGLLAAGLLMAAMLPLQAQQQTPDPFTLPPPTQRPQNPGQPGQGVSPPVLTIEALARQGFDVKAIERASERANGFIVLLQRAGEVRTCLMRIDRPQGQMPRQTSICF